MSRLLKAFIILTLLGLSAYYLAVLYLAAHPNVSYAYRLYYLEMKTRFWNRNQTLAYIPGTRFDFTKERPWILSRQGWSLPKYDGTGSEFLGQGGLYFTLHREPGPLRLEAEVRALKANTQLTFSVGERWHSELTLPHKGAYRIQVPIPANLFIADPIQVNYIAMTGSHPVRFQSLQISHEE